MNDNYESAGGKKNWFRKLFHKLFKKKETKFKNNKNNGKDCKNKMAIEICNDMCSRKMVDICL